MPRSLLNHSVSLSWVLYNEYFCYYSEVIRPELKVSATCMKNLITWLVRNHRHSKAQEEEEEERECGYHTK